MTIASLGRCALILAACLFACLFTDLSNAREKSQAEALVQQLQAGGHVIFFRHGETGPAYADTAKAVIGDCSTQRNLNEEGRRQVARMGEDFQALRIPVGLVLSSEYCRCWQHAEAMFGKNSYQINSALSAPASYPNVTDADKVLNNQNLKELLIRVPDRGTNTVLVSHGVNVLLLTGYHPDIQGEAVIFRPDGKGGYERLGSIMPEMWRELRNQLISQ